MVMQFCELSDESRVFAGVSIWKGVFTCCTSSPWTMGIAVLD